ncbi:RNA polymerase sigma factor [Novosphingobium terrae]|uniref:RNA polymerase sigma factor n=1 Tax=Novosphingobium terrae TaxID=2726189 RepID=UPI00197DD413|nr:RNA polymerase sigma factor [Novosphingobium terrae]
MKRSPKTGLLATFQQHYQDVLRFLIRRTGDVQRAEDIAQDTWCKLAAIREEDRSITHQRAYIYRVAGNLAIDHQRRRIREADWLSGGEPDDTIADPAPSPERSAIAHDRLRQLEIALEALPPKPRLALMLFRVDGLSHAQIAARLGVSESMVAKYLAQALRHCRDHLWALDGK